MDSGEKRLALYIFLFFLLLYTASIGTSVTWNDGSRFAMVESVVEEGALVIDNSTFLGRTGDRALIGGRFYSDKAPGMALTAVPLYGLLNLAGISFGTLPGMAVFLLIFPYAAVGALGISVFFLLTGHYSGDFRARLIATAAVGAGTGIFVFSGTFMPHATTAALLVTSLYLSLEGEDDSRLLAAAGALGGLAVLFEYAAVFLLLGITADLWRRGGNVLPLLLGALPFLLFIPLYNLLVTGSPFTSPYQFVHTWEGSIFRAGDNVPDPSRITPGRAFSMLFFGEMPRTEGIYYRGLFLYSPFLLLGLAWLRREDWALLGGAGLLALLYLSVNDITGGCVYTNRFLIPAIPFLALPALRGIPERPFSFSLLAAAGIVMALPGAVIYPFTCAHVPLFGGVTSFLRNPVPHLPLMVLSGIAAAAVLWMGLSGGEGMEEALSRLP